MMRLCMQYGYYMRLRNIMLRSYIVMSIVRALYHVMSYYRTLQAYYGDATGITVGPFFQMYSIVTRILSAPVGIAPYHLPMHPSGSGELTGSIEHSGRRVVNRNVPRELRALGQGNIIGRNCTRV